MVLCITPPDSSSSAAASSSGAIPRTEGEEAEAEGGGSSSSSCTDAEANAAAAAAAKDDDEALLLLDAAREVRRLCNVVFAFVRQDVREAQHGFLPGSDMERVRFVSHKVGRLCWSVFGALWLREGAGGMFWLTTPRIIIQNQTT